MTHYSAKDSQLSLPPAEAGPKDSWVVFQASGSMNSCSRQMDSRIQSVMTSGIRTCVLKGRIFNGFHEPKPRSTGLKIIFHVTPKIPRGCISRHTRQSRGNRILMELPYLAYTTIGITRTAQHLPERSNGEKIFLLGRTLRLENKCLHITILYRCDIISVRKSSNLMHHEQFRIGRTFA